jgi:hypothetical protein
MVGSASTHLVAKSRPLGTLLDDASAFISVTCPFTSCVSLGVGPSAGNSEKTDPVQGHTVCTKNGVRHWTRTTGPVALTDIYLSAAKQVRESSCLFAAAARVDLRL